MPATHLLCSRIVRARAALLGRLGTWRTSQVAEASSGRFPQPLLMRSGQARPLIPQNKVKRRSM